MSDTSGVSTLPVRNTAPEDKDGFLKAHPVMTALIVIGLVVALASLVIIFMFASHQSKLQDNAQTLATQQQITEQDSLAKTEGTIGPIKVIDTELFNRENGALGQQGSSPKSSITGAKVSIPTTSTALTGSGD